MNSLIVPKMKKGGPLWLIQQPFCCEVSKELNVGTIGDIKNISKNVPQYRKKLKNLVLSGFLCYAKKGTIILVQFPGPKGNFFGFLIFGRTCWNILVSSCGLNKRKHSYSRLSLHEAPTKNQMGWRKNRNTQKVFSGNESRKNMPKNPHKTRQSCRNWRGSGIHQKLTFNFMHVILSKNLMTAITDGKLRGKLMKGNSLDI